jgi:hypothetical protein
VNPELFTRTLLRKLSLLLSTLATAKITVGPVTGICQMFCRCKRKLHSGIDFTSSDSIGGNWWLLIVSDNQI